MAEEKKKELGRREEVGGVRVFYFRSDAGRNVHVVEGKGALGSNRAKEKRVRLQYKYKKTRE